MLLLYHRQLLVEGNLKIFLCDDAFYLFDPSILIFLDPPAFMGNDDLPHDLHGILSSFFVGCLCRI